MRIREMTTIERLRLKVITELAMGRINAAAAATQISLSVRQAKRLKKKFREKGVDGLIHGLRGIPGQRHIDRNMENKIVRIIKDKYLDFGPTMIWEKLQLVHGITLSDETIRAIMIRNGIWHSRKRNRGRYFSWRNRRSAYGELVQFDGSYHDWFEGRNPNVPETCLLAAIDDATGKITGASFGENESVTAVFSFWLEYVKVNGIPKEIYLDKFSTYKINHPKAVDNELFMTQFNRAMGELGTRLIFANSPQAKGRIERLFQTLQDRLVKEMRLLKINTVSDANIFLKETFIPWFNDRYAVIPQLETDCHRTLDIATGQKLKSIFAKQYCRGINNDFTVRYRSCYYQLKEIQPTTVFKADTVLIEERLDETIHMKCKNHYLNFFKLPGRPVKVSKPPVILTAHKSNWIPPKDHPWRQRFLT